MGTRQQPQRALLEAGFAHCGGDTRAPGAGASCLAVGRSGFGALQLPTARPRGVRPGPATDWLWVRGVWAWRPATHPKARALASWLCALLRRHQGARGGRFLPGCLASGVGRSPTPDRLSLERAAGARYPLAVGAGAVGVGTRHLRRSAGSCKLAFCAVGAARGRLGGGASSLAVGRPCLGAL